MSRVTSSLGVVIAILATVASLLLPTLGRSKAAARRIQCVNGVRQLGLAAQLYWEDNASQAFRYRGVFTNGGDLFWFGWLQRGTEGSREFDATQGALYPYLESLGVEICPSLNYSGPHFKLKATGAAYGYGYNLHLSAPASQPPLNISKIAQPVETVLFADAAQVNTFQAPAAPDNPLLEEFYYVNSSEATAHFRHQQSANAVFCDGHVAREKPVPGSIDQKLPAAGVGRLRPECLQVP